MVAEPHAKWAHRNGRILVLWKHGRLTEHPREHGKPSRTIGRHVPAEEANAWAGRHGFQLVGLVPPDRTPDEQELIPMPSETAPAPEAEAATSTATVDPPARDRARAASGQRKVRSASQVEAGSREVLRRVHEGSRVDAAAAAVAAEHGVAEGAIRGALRRYCEDHDIVVPADDVRANGTVNNPRGEQSPVTVQRAQEVQALLEAGGITSKAAVAEVAKRHGVNVTTVHSAYYGWRNRQAGKATRGGPLPATAAPSAPPAPAAAPARQTETEARADRQAIRTAAGRNGRTERMPEAFAALSSAPLLGPSAVEGEEADPLEAVRRLGQAHQAALANHWQALRDARAQLDAQVNAILERMGQLEEREAQLRQVADVLGVQLAPIGEEAV